MRSIRLILTILLAWPTLRSASSQQRPLVPRQPPSNCIWDGLALRGDADVCIGKRVASPLPLLRGHVAAYSLVISNTAALNSSWPITVTDMLPQGLQIAAISLPSTIWRCNTTDAALRCARNVPLAPQTQETITVSVTVKPSAPSLLLNCANVIMPNDSNPTNNQSCVEAPVSWPHHVFGPLVLRESGGSPPGTP